MLDKNFSEYAFIGWVWTITHHQREIDISTCPPEFMWLDDSGDRGWDMATAMRKGWGLLGEEARVFATANLLPLCKPWLRDMMLGLIVCREAQPPLGEAVGG